jgi:hypothetical protein
MMHRSLIIALFMAIAGVQSGFAQTDGSATFQVTTVTAGGNYSPRNVMAIWVTDANTNFVKTLKRQAQSQIRWLTRWGAISKSNVVDGITGATLSSHQAHSVTWNCRNTNNVVVADGTYRIFVEFTEFNGAGPFIQAVNFNKGAAGVTSAPTATANFTSMSLVYVPSVGPPALTPIGNKFTTLSNSIQFAVTATATGGDPVTLSVSNKPASATFGATNTAGTFTWASPAPVGVYTMTFYAVDKDGPVSETVRLYVNPTGTASIGVSLGSPAISVDPADPDQNVVGDDVDFERSGGFAEGLNQGGFGSFGSIYFNGDATNLYIGGNGLNVGATSNGAVIFLAFSTLTNNAGNLWNKSGKPQGLDYLHNIAFTTPMDIAILLGDEHGDATFTDFNLAGGYNFGQGVFSLGPTSFPAVAGARLSQFDGTEGPVSAPDLDGNRLTERWECAIPWTSLNATGIGSIASMQIAGVLAASGTNGQDRYLSGNYLGLAANPGTSGNYGFSFVTLTGLDVALAAGHDLAVTALQPSIANPNTTAILRITVRNLQNSTETFAVGLSNVTSQASIGSVVVSNLAPGAITNVALLWNTTNLALGAYTLRATAGPQASETVTDNNTLEARVLVRSPFHEVAVTALTAPPFIRAGTTSNLIVSVQNLGDYSETFGVSVTDQTDRVLLGNLNVTALPAYQSTNLTFAWNTAGRSTNYHTVQAIAATLAGETQTQDNVAGALVALAPGVVTSTWVAAGSTWKYRQDGLDQTQTPWRQTNYYDSFWAQGATPIGFGNGGEATTLTATQHVTYYFRTMAQSDRLPLTLLVRCRVDDGAVVYFNGVEAARDNLDANPLAFTSRATSARSGTAETNWVSLSIPATNAILGGNTIAVEVHQAGAGGAGSGEPWINEFHYDNNSTDTNEGVEVAGPAGLSLTNYSLVAYNGDDGLSYSTTTLSGTLPNQSNGIGTAWFPIVGLQNGPDGIALVNLSTGVIQFLSYEGAFVANNGPASGRTSTQLAVSETSTNNVGYSLQMGWTGNTYFAFVWKNPAAHSRGLINPGQGITAADTPDLAFDMEWKAVVPNLPARTNLVVSGLAAATDALMGDVVAVSLTVSNGGNSATSFQLILVNTNTQQQVASTNLLNLAPGSVQNVVLPWNTLGLATGTYNLVAYTVVNGVTNLAGAAQFAGVVSGSGWGPQTVNAISSLGGFADAITVAGGFAYLGEGATLTVLDLANPAVPLKRGSLRLTGNIRAVAAAGSHVYAACGEAGLHIVNVSQPDAPTLVQSFDSSGVAMDVAIAGSTLVLADGPQGLRFINIANPAAPALVGTLPTTGPALAIRLSGNTAWVVDGFEGLLAVNVANPASPTVLGRSEILPNGRALALLGQNVLLLDEQARLVVVNGATPSQPAVLARLQLPAPASTIAASGSQAYAGAGAAGVLVLDLANPAAPTVATTLDTAGSAAGIVINAGTAYVADGLAGVQVLSLASPLAPVLLYTHVTGLRARDTALVGNLAVVAAGEQGVQIYSLTNPAAPALLGNLALGNARRVVATDGSRGAVAHGFGTISVADFANAAVPVRLATYSNSTVVSVHALAFHAPKLALTDGATILLLDLTQPANPNLLASASAAAYAHDLAWCGNNLVVADGPAGVSVLDGSSLARVGGYNTAGRALGVECSGAYAFIADGQNGWLTLDLTNPANPVPGAANTDRPVVNMALQGSLLFTASGHGAVQAKDVGAPLTPLNAVQYETLTKALRMVATPAGVVVSEDDAGLALLSTGGADADGDGLPDWWEQALVDADANDGFTSILDILPGGDFDQDGASNRDEWLAGSGATDPDSLFVVQSTAPAPGGFVVRWNSALGRTYTLHQSADLTSGFTAVQTGIPATYPVNSHTVTVSSVGAYFMVTADP